MATNQADPADFDALWDYNQPAATEARFREVLPQVSADPPCHAELLTQIARTQGLQRRFDEAHATLDEVQALLTATTARARIRYLLERGRVFNSAGKAAAARPLFLEAWERGQQAGEDFYTIDAAHMLGIIEAPAEQRRWNRLALALTEQTADPRAKKWLGSLSNNLGWSYFEQGEYTTALDYFYQALAAREQQGDASQMRIARWCIAKTLRVLGQLEEALASQRTLLRENEQANEPDGYVYEELGECHLALGQAEQATPYFAQAYTLLAQDPWVVANEGEKLARLKTLGQVGA